MEGWSEAQLRAQREAFTIFEDLQERFWQLPPDSPLRPGLREVVVA